MTRLDDVLLWKYKDIEANIVDLDKGYLYKAGATYEDIDWNCDLPKPTKKELKDAIPEYEAYKAKIAYLQKRKEEMLTQGINEKAMIEALWDSIVNNSHDKKLDLKAKIDKINADNPPPA